MAIIKARPYYLAAVIPDTTNRHALPSDTTNHHSLNKLPTEWTAAYRLIALQAGVF